MKIGIFLKVHHKYVVVFSIIKIFTFIIRIEKYKSLMEVIITNDEALRYLKEKKIKQNNLN